MSEYEEAIIYFAENPYDFVCQCILKTHLTGIKPTSQQKQILDILPDAIKDGKIIAVKSGHGCFAKGTKIILHNSTIKNVEDISENDCLMGDDGSPRIIRNLCRGKENMYEFELVDGTKYIFNESHILCLVSSQTHGKQRRGDKITITVKDYLKWSERKKRTHCFYRKEIKGVYKKLRIDPYILGTWLGDVGNNTKEVNSFLEDLRSYNLINNKHIPQQYKQSAIKQRLELLAGLLDTDGYLDNKNKRCYSIVQKNKRLAEDILFIVKSVGCHGILKEKIKYCRYKSEKKYGLYYEINITRNIEKIPCKIKRKKAIKIKNPQRNNLHFGIKKVTSLGEGEYYGFELKDNHKFLGHDFSVLHNTGKSALSSWIILWFMFTRPHALIPCTAPTQHQLYDVLWKELSIWHNQCIFKNLFEWRPTSFINKSYPATWKAIARTAKDPEGLAGKHAENMIFVIDEGSGVESNIFETIMGTQTQESNCIICFSNPTKTSGFFHDLFTNPNIAHRVIRFTFSCVDSENVKPQFIEQIKDMYGEESDEYRVRVLGEFPISEFDTLISYDIVEQATKRNLVRHSSNLYEYVELGLDVARFGNDKTECYSRIGDVIEHEFTIKRSDTMYIVSKVMETINKKYMGKQIIINVDDVGVGGGVTDRLKENLRNDLFRGIVNGVNNGSTANDPRFVNLGTEMWYFMKDWLKYGKLPKDIELMKQLSNRKKSMTSSGKNVLERKEQMKNRGLSSPDKADAAILSLFSLIHKVKKSARSFIC